MKLRKYIAERAAQLDIVVTTSLPGFAARKASRIYAVKIASLVNFSVGSFPDGRFPFLLVPMLFCYIDCNELSIEQLHF